MPAKADGMRGLAVFISDIRNCKSREAEEKRINKELANIRSKFKGDKNLDGYQKKKYVCKLLFIFLLGHDIDFGHMEAVNLLSSNKFTEKQIGYLFISVLLGTGNDLLKLVIQSIRNDLTSRNQVFATLALQCIANINSREMAEAFAQEIPKLLVGSDTNEGIKQSCALCLLRLIQTAPDIVRVSELSTRFVHLLNDPHMGVVTSSASLLDGLARTDPDSYKGSINLAVTRLCNIVNSASSDLQDYAYYFVPAPWLSVKLLHLLQNYSPPVIIEDGSTRNRLTEVFNRIMNRAQEAPKSKKVQHTNAKHAVLFEMINLVVHMDCDAELLVRACDLLGAQFLQHRETNLRYLALESMCLLATSEHSHDAVKKHQETVINALKTEYDVSVRQRAADLLYAMCDKSNVKEIVAEMLAYLEVAIYSIREELVLKVAILAEKYAIDYTWYVDTILNLIRIAGDHVSEEVWYRVIQIVVNQDDVQGYAAKTVFEALQAPACHENMVKVGGYVLGEFGNLIALDPRSSPTIQFQLLHSKFHLCSPPTRQLLLSTYIKFVNLFPEVKPLIQEVFKSDNHARNSDVEIQQRAVEYGKLSSLATADILAIVLEEMPPFPEKESSIQLKLKKKSGDKTQSDTGVHISNTSSPQTITGGMSNQALTSPSSDKQTKGENNDSGISDLLGLDDSIATTSSTAARFTISPDGSDNSPNDTSGVVRKESFSELASSHLKVQSIGQQSYDFHNEFICKQNGILYESDMLQIGLKVEYKQNIGALRLYFGNKTSMTFTNFAATVQPTALLSSHDLCIFIQLRVETSSSVLVLAGGAQIEQLVHVTCALPFTDHPQLIVQFNHSFIPQRIEVALPVTLNKFLDKTVMDAAQFFQRWKLLSLPDQESVVVKASDYLDGEFIKTKLAGFGFAVLDGIDPNHDNFVCAGVLHTVPQIGCLLRLEPNRQIKMYRLTIRTSKENVAKILCDLLQTQL